MPTYTVFISYKHRIGNDIVNHLAKIVYDYLKARAVDVHLDVNATRHIGLWPHLATEIYRRDNFVLILEPGTLESEWVRKEIDWALALDRNIILVFEPSLDFEHEITEEFGRLRDRPGVEYNYKQADPCLEQIVKSLVVQQESEESKEIKRLRRRVKFVTRVAVLFMLLSVMFGLMLAFRPTIIIPSPTDVAQVAFTIPPTPTATCTATLTPTPLPSPTAEQRSPLATRNARETATHQARVTATLTTPSTATATLQAPILTYQARNRNAGC